MGRHRESQAHVHTTGITLDRCIQKLFDLREGHDLIKFSIYLGTLHAQNGTVEVDVLPTGELGVKTGAHLQQ
ncbi:hypothetical protein SDC9_143146 [bioreactor metagenome]|uniref:Uncharacterized protein n=1 Tax=bioreactor metagenome TaxID=1076179 RepID=A0A645E2I7_9ZZZZ